MPVGKETKDWLDMDVQSAIGAMGDIKDEKEMKKLKKLAKDLKDEGLYYPLNNEVHAERADPQTFFLSKILHDHGIKVFKNEDVEIYKDEKAFKHNKKLQDDGRHESVSKSFEMAREIYVDNNGNIFKEEWAAKNATRGNNSNYHRTEQKYKIITTKISLYEWVDELLSGFKAHVPVPILERTLVVKKACQSAGIDIRIGVEDLILKQTERQTEIQIGDVESAPTPAPVPRSVDPFIYVCIPDEYGRVQRNTRKFYFGVWDEPDFNAEACLPGE